MLTYVGQFFSYMFYIAHPYEIIYILLYIYQYNSMYHILLGYY